jgi:hypothetical protein
MVTGPGTAVGAHGLRPLGLPAAVDVEIGADGLPGTVLHAGQRHAVTTVEALWRVVEAWWREDALVRTYVRVRLDDERVLTLFHDDRCVPQAGWYEQRY